MTEPSLANNGYHGTRGPLNVQYTIFTTPLREEYIKAGEEIGWRFGDYNGKEQKVIGYQQSTMNGILRENTPRAYLKPIRDRNNLDIILESRVSNVIIENRVAKGVEYSRGNITYRVYARKDVILSAGAVDTPKLLMLSGIGPKNELRRHNITQIMDLPVGSKFNDHVLTVIPYRLVDDAPTITAKEWKTNESIIAYAKNRQGPLSMGFMGTEVVSFFNPLQEDGLPQVQVIFASSASALSENDPSERTISVVLLNVKTKSVGSLSLRSKDFRDPPLIDPRHFAEDEDRIAMEKGIEIIDRFMGSSTMSKYSPRLYTKKAQPKCHGRTGRVYASCVISQYSSSGLHPVATAKMGPRNCKDSVVDSEDLLVKGIRKLRVVDASIMPTGPRGNTYAPVVMVAEKAADIIKSHNR